MGNFRGNEDDDVMDSTVEVPLRTISQHGMPYISIDGDEGLPKAAMQLLHGFAGAKCTEKLDIPWGGGDCRSTTGSGEDDGELSVDADVDAMHYGSAEIAVTQDEMAQHIVNGDNNAGGNVDDDEEQGVRSGDVTPINQ